MFKTKSTSNIKHSNHILNKRDHASTLEVPKLELGKIKINRENIKLDSLT